MTETYVDVPLTEIRVGDEVKMDGFGAFTLPSGQISAVELSGRCYEIVSDAGLVYVSIKDGGGVTRFRRSSITAARRRVEKPATTTAQPWACGRCFKQRSVLRRWATKPRQSALGARKARPAVTEKREHIKVCPFCGSTVVEVYRTNPYACWIRCGNEDCRAETSSHKTRRGAIQKWNQRADDRPARVIYDQDKESEAKRG